MWLFLLFASGFVVIGAIWVTVTLLVVPGLAEERLGRLEDLPADLGQWRDDPERPDGDGAEANWPHRQSRLWLDPGGDWLGRERIVRQVRWVDHDGEVVRSGPEVRVRRRRIRD